ncbi:MAG: NAD(P)H-quinone dehydrogenase [Actinobacteria bacterium]|nr:NAD(P)H-quinone dehydrogenase [Actinomycetota bacterium]
MTSVVIIGGGPGGYEAALVAAQLGAQVTLIDASGIGGSAVLTDCVPSKALIATAEVVTMASESGDLGVRIHGQAPAPGVVHIDMALVNGRVKKLAAAQSQDIEQSLRTAGVTLIHGRARLVARNRVSINGDEIDTDVILLATGARPRVVSGAEPDGERILTWEQIYDLPELPAKLIVVGSGVTGAELASAYNALGSEVVLVSSRDRVLPGEDADAAAVIEDVFRRRGMQVLSNARAETVTRTDHGVRVVLQSGEVLEGSHALMAVGSVPNTGDLGLEDVGVRCDPAGFIATDRVSRTSVQGIYAAGDCTGVLMLASTAAMQGRIAMRHAIGDAVVPLDLKGVCANVFTDPEIATVGWSQNDVDAGLIDATSVHLPLATNARAKMVGLEDGFVKLFCRPGTGIVIGGVVVAPKASELIYPIAIAVDQQLSVDQIANSFTVYPSMTGSIAEAARRLHLRS